MSELASSNGHAAADPDLKKFVGDFGPRERTSIGKASVPQTRNSLGNGVNLYEELGRTGLRHWGGFVFEEWLRELQQGRRAAEVFREMQDSDPVIGAIMYAIQMLIRRVDWWVEPHGSKEAEWLESVLHDMSTSWPDTISEIISFLGYGYSYHETNFKLRKGETRDPATNSKFNDGYIGLSNLPLRSQDSLWKWVFDDNGTILGMIQNPPPDYLLRFIPIEKAAHFRTTIFKNNPEGRPLALDTLVRTPDGWATMETIQTGDQVFDETGEIRNVVGKSEVFRNRPCYEIEFSSGHTVIADASHEWLVTTQNDRTVGTSRTLTTEQLFEWQSDKEPMRSDARLGSVRKKPSFCCGRAAVLDGDEQDLPFDPYLLGYWLGDGKTSGASFSTHDDDLAHLMSEIERCGYSGRRIDGTFAVTVRGGMLADLREAGVLNNKHIPRAYLNASPQQRLALLQGLMDSDGYTPLWDDKQRPSVFANSDARLIRDVCELVRTLGGQPRTRITDDIGDTGGTTSRGVITATKTCYAVSFYLSHALHRLPRKATRQERKLTLKSCGHFIKSIRRVENHDTVCIEVDSPSHLFLAGEGMVPTHNSILRNAYRPWYFKRNLENIEGIGVERDLAGLPVLSPPEGVDIWDANDPSMATVRGMAQSIVSSIRRDEQEGVILPFGWELTLLSTGGRRQFDTNAIISRYDNRIATSVLADMVLMGQDKVGSYALAVTKKDLFANSLEAYLDIISSVFQTQIIPRLWRLNGFTMPMPQLKHGSIETIDLDTLGNFIMRLAGGGAPFEWKTTMPYLLDQAGMPQASADFDYDDIQAMATIKGPLVDAAADSARAEVPKPADPANSRNVGRSSMGAGVKGR